MAEQPQTQVVEEVKTEAPVVAKPVVTASPVVAEETYSVAQSVIDLFVKAASKLELTLAKEELLKNIK